MILTRYQDNPVLLPDKNNSWESYAAFNGSIIKRDGEYNLFYRAMGEDVTIEKKRMRLSVVGQAKSHDGLHFDERNKFIYPQYEWEKYGCEDPRVTKVEDKYLIFYTALGNFPPDYNGIRTAVAISPDLKTISEKHLVTPFNSKAMTIFPEKINDEYMVLLTVNTDNPPSHIAWAKFKEIKTLWDIDFWDKWYRDLDRYLMPVQRVSSDGMEIGAPPVKTSSGWLLIYSYIKHYFNNKIKKQFRIEALLLDNYEPQKIIGRIETPLLIPEKPYELNGNIGEIVFPSGALIEDGKIKIYYGGADTNVSEAEGDLPSFMKLFETNTPVSLKCDKFLHNPLLTPIEEHQWEEMSVFNPASLEIDNKVYLIYRAMSKEGVSRLGLAVSNDGELIDERLSEPIYPLRSIYEIPYKQGSAGGCEDPRVTRIGDILYMFYTAFDGQLPRLAMTSITVSDFLARAWDKWQAPKIISPPNIADKDGMLFPEKVNDKYVIFHRIEPNITIDYVDNLDFAHGQFLKITSVISPHNKTWDERKIGINTPPLKTEAGWIVFYHGISEIDGYYRIGALLLDLKDVTKVISWTHYPILEPQTSFEKEGVIGNVVFPCGYVLKDKKIYLYYGGADRVICGATILLDNLLDYLRKSASKKYLDY